MFSKLDFLNRVLKQSCWYCAIYLFWQHLKSKYGVKCTGIKTHVVFYWQGSVLYVTVWYSSQAADWQFCTSKCKEIGLKTEPCIVLFILQILILSTLLCMDQCISERILQWKCMYVVMCYWVCMKYYNLKKLFCKTYKMFMIFICHSRYGHCLFCT